MTSRVAVLALVAAVAALVASDVASESANRYWAGHTMLSSFLSGLLLLGATVLIVDRLLVRRDAARYELLARQALDALRLRMLNADILLNRHFNDPQSVGLGSPLTGVSSWRDPQALAKLDWLASDPHWTARLTTTADYLARDSEDALRSWSPVLLQHPELAPVAQAFAPVVGGFTLLSIDLKRAGDMREQPLSAGRDVYRLLHQLEDARQALRDARPLARRLPLALRIRARLGLADQLEIEEGGRLAAGERPPVAVSGRDPADVVPAIARATASRYRTLDGDFALRRLAEDLFARTLTRDLPAELTAPPGRTYLWHRAAPSQRVDGAILLGPGGPAGMGARRDSDPHTIAR